MFYSTLDILGCLSKRVSVTLWKYCYSWHFSLCPALRPVRVRVLMCLFSWFGCGLVPIYHGIQFRQRFGQIKDRNAKKLVKHFWQGMTLRLEGSRNLFQVSLKITHDWLKDGRVSNFVDISILFMKTQKESCSRFGSKYQHTLFWRVLSSCMP